MKSSALPDAIRHSHFKVKKSSFLRPIEPLAQLNGRYKTM
jgi:hypothetical protein